MKLIELLVQELPNRGGWPNGVNSISQDDDGSLCLWNKLGAYNYQGYWKHPEGNGLDIYWCGENSMQESRDRGDSLITKEQYESALAASKQVEWDGEGLPPEGAECEVKSGKDSWTLCKIVHSSSAGVAFIYLEEPDSQSSYLGVLDCICRDASLSQFRPIRTEAERKRDQAIAQMMERSAVLVEVTAGLIYDAIAAGEINGIKLAD